MDPKQVAKADQALTWMINEYPKLWRGMYLKLIEEGFSEHQAFILVKTFISKREETT